MMAYRRTDNVTRRLTARREAILDAARAAAAEGGMAAVHIAPVAARAHIAAGTVYRYFPSKTDLIAELVAATSERDLGAMRRAAQAAPGPLSALAASLITLAARALQARRLTWALLGESAEAEIDAVRLPYRRALAGELESRIRAAAHEGHLPDQNAELAAAAFTGALIEVLVGPLAPEISDEPAKLREAVQMVTLLCLRAVGVVDARARGLVVQTALPASDDEGMQGIIFRRS
jgi:AcrR family transcriptional regulator